MLLILGEKNLLWPKKKPQRNTLRLIHSTRYTLDIASGRSTNVGAREQGIGPRAPNRFRNAVYEFQIYDANCKTGSHLVLHSK